MSQIVPLGDLQKRIYLLRGLKVMLDFDLAELYGTSTKALIQAVKRNPERFPDDFIFLINNQKLARLRSQIVTSKPVADEETGL